MIIDFILSDFCLPHGKRLNPTDLANDPFGISGTEVNLFGNAFELSKRGHEIKIFSRWTQENQINNLYFVDFDKKLITSDVAIAYHDGRPLKIWNTRFKIALHQTFEIPEGVQASGADLYLSATYFNMKHHWERDNARWAVLPNACNFGEYHPWVPEKGRMIFHTDPNRGLHILLRALPEIKKQVSQANLHIYQDVLNPKRYAYKHIYKEIMEGLDKYKDFITIHDGMHSKNDILKALSYTSVFAYPSEPPVPCEVFPISVMECCATGVPVVLSPADGIENIYRDVVDIVPSPPSDNLNYFIEETVKILNNDNYAKIISERELEWSKGFSFEKTATILENLINKYYINNVRKNNIIFAGNKSYLPKILELYPYIKKEVNTSLDLYVDINNKDEYIKESLNKLYSLGVTNYGEISKIALYNEISKSKLIIIDPQSFLIDLANSLRCIPVQLNNVTEQEFINIVVEILRKEEP